MISRGAERQVGFGPGVLGSMSRRMLPVVRKGRFVQLPTIVAEEKAGLVEAMFADGVSGCKMFKWSLDDGAKA